MSPADHAGRPVGDQTVPDALLGCWRRNWIRFGDDGDLQRDVTVIWLQTASGMGDLRIDPARTPEQYDSSCGLTFVDETTHPYMTADWVDGETGFAQQAVPSFPEKGWLSWQSDSVMLELAPSGAYVEEWERLDGSAGVVAHYADPSAATQTNLYVAGQHFFLAVARAAGELVHEFTYGIQLPGEAQATAALSTRPSRVGQALPTGDDLQLVSRRSV